MSQVSMTGDDTNIVDGRVLADLGDGDCAVLTFPNDIAKGKTGKNKNTIFALDMSGEQSDLVLRVLLGSPDDKYLNTRLESQVNAFAGFVLLTGRFVKKVGDGKGNVTKSTYVNGAGIFSKRVEVKSNQEGEVSQSIAEYHIKYFNNKRIIG